MPNQSNNLLLQMLCSARQMVNSEPHHQTASTATRRLGAPYTEWDQQRCRTIASDLRASHALGRRVRMSADYHPRRELSGVDPRPPSLELSHRDRADSRSGVAPPDLNIAGDCQRRCSRAPDETGDRAISRSVQVRLPGRATTHGVAPSKIDRPSGARSQCLATSWRTYFIAGDPQDSRRSWYARSENPGWVSAARRSLSSSVKP
jgi:hypothetical protein